MEYMMIVAKKSILFAILLGHLAVVFCFWGSGNLDYFGSGNTAGDIWVSIGRIFGLLLVTAVLFQMIIIGRIRFIEQTFGHDKLARLHHWTGYSVVLLLFGHVVPIFIGYGLLSNMGFVAQFAGMLGVDDLLQAAIAFLLLLAVLVLSIIIVVSKMKYEWWYFPHLLTYAAVLLAFGHQTGLGQDLQGSFSALYWTLLYAVVLGLVGWSRFLIPLMRYFTQKFFVESIHPENDSVLSVYIKGKDIAALGAQAGQFFIFRFFAKGLWWQAHPFSLSYAPHADRIRISAKAVGDFTSSLRTALKPGVKVLVEGPFGVFGRTAAQDNKVLLVAGGIGITPVRSVFETLRQKDAVLVYAAKTEQDFVLKNELDEIARANGTKALYLTGSVDEEKLLASVPDAAERAWYVCGPVPMMKAMRSIARDMGVEDKNFHWERFRL
jgi:predicted ferric reductase